MLRKCLWWNLHEFNIKPIGKRHLLWWRAIFTPERACFDGVLKLVANHHSVPGVHAHVVVEEQVLRVHQFRCFYEPSCSSGSWRSSSCCCCSSLLPSWSLYVRGCRARKQVGASSDCEIGSVCARRGVRCRCHLVDRPTQLVCILDFYLPTYKRHSICCYLTIHHGQTAVVQRQVHLRNTERNPMPVAYRWCLIRHL